MSRFSIPISLFWLVFVLIAFSDAASHFFITVLAVLLLGLWGLSWFLRGGLLLAEFFFSRSPQEPSKPALLRELLYLGIEPAAIALSLALVSYNIPTSIRLKLSEPALTSYVQEVQAGRRPLQQGGDPGRRVGLFNVQETELLEGGVVRLITAEDFIDHAGFVYSPQQPPQQPPIVGEDSYRHLYGSWWLWHRSW